MNSPRHDAKLTLLLIRDPRGCGAIFFLPPKLPIPLFRALEICQPQIPVKPAGKRARSLEGRPAPFAARKARLPVLNPFKLVPFFRPDRLHKAGNQAGP